MAGAAVAAESGVWESPDRSIRIEYSGPVMDQIRIAAIDGYHLVPHGGVEVGGVLFGTRLENGVRILAWRTIACEYARGPSFVLSEKDEAGLQALLAASDQETELAGLEPVGWFHSHTRSEIFLSEGDLDLYRRFFPGSWQVALVVRPASFVPTRAGFFFREAGGVVYAASSYREFQLNGAMVAVEAAVSETPAETAASGAPVIQDRRAVLELAAPAEEVHPPAEERLIPELVPAATSPGRRARWVWYLLSLLAVAVVAAAAFWQWQGGSRRLALSASEIGGQLHISWNRSAIPIRSATGGLVEIQDGSVHTQVRLTPADLRTGSISYARESGDVFVRLTVEPAGEPSVEEATRFLKPGDSKPAALSAAPALPPLPRSDPEKQALEREADAMRARIDQQKTELSRLEKMVGTMHASRVAITKHEPEAPQTPARTAGQAAPFSAPVTPVKEPPKQQVAQAPAVLPAAESRKSESMSQKLVPPDQGQRMPAAVPPPAQVPNTAPPPKIAAQPSAGTVIWTGRLPKNVRLVIEGGRASIGVLNGSLPAGAATVAAYPGDLTDQGITLFTPDLKYARPLTEPPAARNGWNRTTYMWDPKRASSIRVVEQPSTQNGHRLVLLSESSKNSVILLEWQSAP